MTKSKTTHKSKIKNFFRTAFSVVLWATLGFAVLLLIFSFVAQLSGNKKAVFGIGLYQIISGSMEPEIMVGDIVAAKSATIDTLKIGDNVVFSYEGKIVTHKVMEIYEGYIVTKGVANNVSENVPAKDIIAKQLFLLKKFGYVVDFLRSGYGFLLIIVLPLSGLIISQGVSLSKRLKEYKEEKVDKRAETGRLAEEIASLKAVLDAADDPAQAPQDKGSACGQTEDHDCGRENTCSTEKEIR